MSDKWFSTSEISQRWGIAYATIRMAIKKGRILPDECRKTGYGPYGGVWLIREDAVRRLWGRSKLTAEEISQIESVLGVKPRDRFDPFKRDELADYLDGRRFPEFDEPMLVSEEQRATLREIYERL